MNTYTVLLLAALGFILSATTGFGQEGIEKLPKLPKKVDAPLLIGPSCNTPCPSIKVLPVIQQKPICVLTPREVITTIKRPAKVIAYRDDFRTVTEMVMKQQEVVRKVPCTEMLPCKVVDPHTGCCRTILKPVTTFKYEKDIVFRAVPESRKIPIKVPYIKIVEEEVTQRNVLLEYKTEYEPRTYAIGVPYTVLQDRYWLAQPACTCPSTACPLHPQ